jgi:RNA polymerase sigma factor (sigma-70 family)
MSSCSEATTTREPGRATQPETLLRNSTVVKQPASSELTPKQRQVADLYQAGMSQRAIATHLHLDRSTVRQHLKAATEKLTK